VLSLEDHSNKRKGRGLCGCLGVATLTAHLGDDNCWDYMFSIEYYSISVILNPYDYGKGVKSDGV